ncbi:MAG TPA: OmpA family protein [Polyangiaceae bacterium]|nr:OmpA family protein [Polyangiaceae bacterium]
MSYKLNRAPKAIAAVLAAAALFGGLRYAVTHGLLSAPTLASKVPERANLPAVREPESALAALERPVTMPGTTPGCSDKTELRALVWAWNAQMGWMFANGGPRTTVGSLMCEHGVNLKFSRQDDAEQMKAELLKFATSLKNGESEPREGAHFVAIMGDGAAQFFAGLNPALRRLGPEYKAQVVASAGYSRGEDKFMGLPEWKRNPESARGAYVAGYLKDGDWNIALKWAGDNGICNNPDEKSYDPQCLNWAGAKDYIDAAQKYVAHYCVDLPTKGKRGQTSHVCVNGVVTWTPGDVLVAEKRGGLVSVASTKEYASQMPNVIIGIEPYMSRHRELVEGMIAATLAGGRAVKSSHAALERGADVSDQVYAEKDTGKAYWLKYYAGSVERDAQGLSIELGGSKVNDLGDDVALFGLRPGYANAFEATYTTFGKIVHDQYPNDVPSFPAASEVLNTSFLERVLAAEQAPVDVRVETPAYVNVASAETKTLVGRRSWQIQFDTGKDSFRPEATEVLNELMRGLIVAGNTAVEVHGHTDNQGNADVNQVLSEKRAFAVKNWLKAHASANFPDSRFQVFAHGATEPLRPNDTESGRAANRRVDIVLLSR